MKIIRVAVLALSLMLSAGGADAEHEKTLKMGFATPIAIAIAMLPAAAGLPPTSNL